jgi:adenosylcobinamide-phosphate synthase
MKYFGYNILALLIGFALDLLIGDPEGWPHPVIWIGRFISFLEKKLRARGGDLRKGAVLLTAHGAPRHGVTAACWSGALWASPPSWQAERRRLALSCGEEPVQEGPRVERALAVSGGGAVTVGRLLGRDTASLTDPEIIRAAVETVAENATDGGIAPMLFFFLGGPGLAMGFKAASTLDSMVGYLDEKYRDIGWSSARLDDILNFIPARLCGPLMCLARPLGLDGKNPCATCPGPRE